MTFTYYIDGTEIGTYIPAIASELKNAEFTPSIWSGCAGGGCTDKSPRTVTGYFDNVRMGAIEDIPNFYDDFNSAENENSFDKSLWDVFSQQEGNVAQQRDGSMILVSKGYDNAVNLLPLRYNKVTLDAPIFIETLVKLPPGQNGGVGIHVAVDGKEEFVSCHIWGENDRQSVYCDAPMSPYPVEDLRVVNVEPDTWHVLRIELAPAIPEFSFYIDREKAGQFTLSPAENYKSAKYILRLWSGCEGVGCNDKTNPRIIEGYFDYVKIGDIP
jgi:hypothetical protein